MRRSEINQLMRDAAACFGRNGWTLPPKPQWDVTDFGLGDCRTHGLVLINLANEAEYCEKLMYARRGMVTPCHCHQRKKEDIICRCGEIKVRAWPGLPKDTEGQRFELKIDGEPRVVTAGDAIHLVSGQRITMVQRVYHEFVPVSDEAVLGEVSTANDDVSDNFFVNPNIGRFPDLVEDEEEFRGL